MPGGTAVVTINGLPYVARMPIQHFQIQQQTDPFRTTGAFLRTNNPKLEPYAFNDWSRGFGTKFIRPGHPEDMRGFFDASVMTIWKKGITLPIAGTDLGEPISGGRLEASAHFAGGLWGLFVADDDDGDTDTVVARVTTATTWGGGGNVLTETSAPAGVRSYDMIGAGDRLYAILGFGNSHALRYSTDGVSWSAPATTAPPNNLLFNKASMIATNDGARLAYDGTNVVLALEDITNSLIKILVSTDGGDTWTNPAGGAISFGSGGGVKGLVTYLDTDNTTVVYLGSREGLWLIDLAAGTAELILELPIANENCRRMKVHNGSLYVPVDNGNDAPFGMKKITVRDGNRIIEDVGLDITQGIPTNLLGFVRWMVSAGPFLIITLGGGASGRHDRILSITGLPDEGWENIFKNATANEVNSWVDVFGNNLYRQSQGHTPTTSGNTIALVNLLAPPKTGVTHKFAANPEDLELPEAGGDAPEEPGGFFQVQADAEDLVDGAEFLDFEYGLNGADPTTDDTITIDSTNRKQNLGTSDRGLSARTIRQNIEFNRGGDSSLSPLLREWVLLLRKKTEELHGYEFDIDAEATERSYGRGQDQIRDELQALRRQAELFEFIESGDEGAVQVEMPTFNDADWVTAGPGSQSKSQLEGLIRVRLEEILQH